jgi:hypothetical protein
MAIAPDQSILMKGYSIGQFDFGGGLLPAGDSAMQWNEWATKLTSDGTHRYSELIVNQNGPYEFDGEENGTDDDASQYVLGRFTGQLDVCGTTATAAPCNHAACDLYLLKLNP